MKDPLDENARFQFGDRFLMSEGAEDPTTTPENGSPSAPQIPQRYIIKEVGDERVLSCLEAPNLVLKMATDLSISAAAARKSPPGSIFLDGAANSEPFMDHQKKVYNFDHHEGCVRPFTLSTCEQVLVLILKGLDLRDREWKFYANEPDLDAILAIWLLFNHQRIGRKDTIHSKLLFSLVRLEGVIDAHGLELAEFSALPSDRQKKIFRIIEYLRREEIRLKKDGLWEEIDLLEYTASVLHKMDRIIYRTKDFNDFRGVKELSRVELTGNRMVAVVESDSGIYELEPHLNQLYGDRLGLVVLKKSSDTYTIRRMDLFMPGSIEDVYERLNFMDPAVRGRSEANRWGGSTDIGGSPRGIGTQLTPQEIAGACRDALQKPSISVQAYSLLQTAVLTGLVISPAVAAKAVWASSTAFFDGSVARLVHHPEYGFIVVLILSSILALFLPNFKKRWLYGIAMPAGQSWWWLFPLVVFFSWGGGIWLPGDMQPIGSWSERTLYLSLAFPLAAELLFRGLAHGLLARNAPIQYAGGRWFLSWPTVGSAFLYAAFTGFLFVSTEGNWGALFTGWHTGNVFGAFAFGIAVGMVRERSQSLLPGLLFHVVSVLILLGIRVGPI